MLVLGLFCHKMSPCGGICCSCISPGEIMLERFQQFLIKNGSIGQEQIPYFIKWVMDCYSFINCQTDTIIATEQRKQYLEYLSKIREDWQVKQADQALRLYLFFLSKVNRHPDPTNDSGRLWEQALENMVNVLRLKHMSLNTEKTYIIWSRQFQRYINKCPEALSTDDVRNFLSYLSAERKVRDQRKIRL